MQILPALNNGGVERGTVEVANYLARNGHSSIVVSAGGIMQEQLHQNVEHICLPVGKKSISTLLLVKKLKQLIIDKNIQIVHARSRLPAWLALWAMTKIKRKKAKLITTIHGLYSVKKYSSVMARGDKVIVVSKTALDYVMENYKDNLKCNPKLIYRGIDPTVFNQSRCEDNQWKMNWAKINNCLDQYKLVLLPGRLTDLKGVRELELWLKNSTIKSQLVLTAKPDLDKYTEKLYHWFRQIGVSEKIIWTGQVKDMAQLYACVDVVVSTSIRPESFGRTVLESLSVGTPVVAYDHGGVAEILSELFPYGKVDVGNKLQLSEKIDQQLMNPNKIKSNQMFLLNNMLEQTVDLYLEAVNE